MEYTRNQEPRDGIVDIIGILNSPSTQNNGNDNGNGNGNDKASSNTRDSNLNFGFGFSYSSIAAVDFPAIEVTVNNNTTEDTAAAAAAANGSSADHYYQSADDLHNRPISPLTPSVTDRKQFTSPLNSNAVNGNDNSNGNGKGRSKAKLLDSPTNLMNVLQRMATQQERKPIISNHVFHTDNQSSEASRASRSSRSNSAYSSHQHEPPHPILANTSSISIDTPTQNNIRNVVSASQHEMDLELEMGTDSDSNIDMDNTEFTASNTYQYQHHNNHNNQQPQTQQRRRSIPPPPTPTPIPPQPKEATLHAQTFVLALSFLFIWSPQNLMAPNLTQMATYFNFSPEQRDLYLGANIAFATGVLSLPVSALLGFLADVVNSRIQLFAGTVFMGGVSAICTGYAKSYTQLYFARFFCGGCMAGSVPIAFSILGDCFDAKDRNAASSGLTAMMGAGILFGQVSAGMVGDVVGWQRPFYISGCLSIVTSLMVLQFVREPVRGGKEKVLQEMIAKGTKYDRKLTLKGFLIAMTQNKTNVILMLQGFFTNVPWGVIFTFLNDYLSQEQGLSVPASTILVLWFGIGSATGGILGGYWGTIAMGIRRSYLPLFMAFSTLLGILPFLGLLDMTLLGHGWLGVFLAFSGGCIANLPSVNVRPCLLNVNPPETRGAAMTAANLMINVARGAGPSLITLSQSVFNVSRQYSFNLSIIVFWIITTVLLLILAKTLPSDQDAMDAELAKYAESKINGGTGSVNATTNYGGVDSGSDYALKQGDGLQQQEYDDASKTSMSIMSPGGVGYYDNTDNHTQTGEESIVSIEDRMTSFDAAAAQESWTFIEDAIREIAGLSHNRGRTNSDSNYHVVSSHDNYPVVWSSGGPPYVIQEQEDGDGGDDADGGRRRRGDGRGGNYNNSNDIDLENNGLDAMASGTRL